MQIKLFINVRWDWAAFSKLFKEWSQCLLEFFLKAFFQFFLRKVCGGSVWLSKRQNNVMSNVEIQGGKKPKRLSAETKEGSNCFVRLKGKVGTLYRHFQRLPPLPFEASLFPILP